METIIKYQHGTSDAETIFTITEISESSDANSIDGNPGHFVECMSMKQELGNRDLGDGLVIEPHTDQFIPNNFKNEAIIIDSESDTDTDVSEKKDDGGRKPWTKNDMASALDTLRTRNISVNKVSGMFGIPSSTLRKHANEMGIDMPKRNFPLKSWSDDSLNSALNALRTGQSSGNKVAKAYGIPASTLYKMARKEGIQLATPFKVTTSWTKDDLERALEAIRTGNASVQEASTEFGIATGTLYSRLRREGIDISKTNLTPWSEDAMTEALGSVRNGRLSIRQASIRYKLPYTALYSRFKRGKSDINETSPKDTSGNNPLQYSPCPSSQKPQHSQQQTQQQPQQQSQQQPQQQIILQQQPQQQIILQPQPILVFFIPVNQSTNQQIIYQTEPGQS